MQLLQIGEIGSGAELPLCEMKQSCVVLVTLQKLGSSLLFKTPCWRSRIHKNLKLIPGTGLKAILFITAVREAFGGENVLTGGVEGDNNSVILNIKRTFFN